MPAAARIGDSFGCGASITSGSPNVFKNGIPAARLTDSDSHGSMINDGSSNVFINGLPAARIGDTRSTCPIPNNPHNPGPIAEGSPNIFTGG